MTYSILYTVSALSLTPFHTALSRPLADNAQLLLGPVGWEAGLSTCFCRGPPGRNSISCQDIEDEHPNHPICGTRPVSVRSSRTPTNKVVPISESFRRYIWTIVLSILAHPSPSPLNCVNQNWAQGCHRVRSFPIISTPWTLWVFVVFPQEGHHFGLNELGQETTARRHCLERALGVGDVVSHGCYNECIMIMSVTFLDLNGFCQNRLTLILAILLW